MKTLKNKRTFSIESLTLSDPKTLALAFELIKDLFIFRITVGLSQGYFSFNAIFI